LVWLELGERLPWSGAFCSEFVELAVFAAAVDSVAVEAWPALLEFVAGPLAEVVGSSVAADEAPPSAASPIRVAMWTPPALSNHTLTRSPTLRFAGWSVPVLNVKFSVLPVIVLVADADSPDTRVVDRDDRSGHVFRLGPALQRCRRRRLLLGRMGGVGVCSLGTRRLSGEW
jgi:hypothetical protein